MFLRLRFGVLSILVINLTGSDDTIPVFVVDFLGKQSTGLPRQIDTAFAIVSVHYKIHLS